LPDGQISSSDLGALVMRAPPKTAPESPRGKTNFARDFKLMSLSGSPAVKISLSEIQKSCIFPAIPSQREGRFARIVTTRGAGCGGRDGVGRFGAQRSAMSRTAKVCRPGAPVAGAESRVDEPRDDGDNKARSLRGEHANKPLKPSRRECR
jgi:hypothetical protein